MSFREWKSQQMQHYAQRQELIVRLRLEWVGRGVWYLERIGFIVRPGCYAEVVEIDDRGYVRLFLGCDAYGRQRMASASLDELGTTITLADDLS